MSELIPNYVHGEWVTGNGSPTALYDPVLGEELVRVSSAGIDVQRAFGYARITGKAGLREMSYEARAKALAACAAVLKQNREKYLNISLANSGTTSADSSIDVDGAIFTVSYYAKAGATLGAGFIRRDGDPADLAKDGVFRAQHVLTPIDGLALFINAFNFPAWGLWEKAAPALLSGVPVVVKPATSTSWLTQQMVHDIVAANVLPKGALSVICGGSDGLMDALKPFDVISFTGSAATAATLRRHAAIAEHSVRANIESDSVNSALLGPAAGPESDSFRSLVREVVREMTSKSGQKCTAIRRVFVPEQHLDSALQAISTALAAVTVGNPRSVDVTMGSLVSRQQRRDVETGIQKLKEVSRTVFDGGAVSLIDADSDASAVLAPWLFTVDDSTCAAEVIHTTEVFGPVATVIPYRDIDHALQMIKAGEGSLVCSLYNADPTESLGLAMRLAEHHGRVHVVTPDVAKTHTGHGNVMPMSLHGGPGRAGGGEELGGLRALGLYHRRSVLQAGKGVLDGLSTVEALGI